MTEPIDGEFSVVKTEVVGNLVQVEDIKDITVPSPPITWAPIPVPDGWTLNETALTKKTPANRIFRHPSGFNFVQVSYVIQRLNEAFGAGHWFFRKVNVTFVGEPETRTGARELMVEGYLVAPGLASPIYGVGSSKYRPNNAQALYSTTIAAAESIALKNAAKKLGIGADVNEGEEGSELVAGKQRTIQTTFDHLVTKGKSEQALAAVRRVCPEAISDNKLVSVAIGEDHLDTVFRALTDIVASI